MARRKKRIHHAVYDYFLPHKRNGYHPGVFALGSVTALLVILLALFVVYIGGIKVSSKSGFFASVVPAALTTFTNADREAVSLAALEMDPILSKAAQMKAEDMAAKGYFAHVSPEGRTPWYWLDAVGYKYSYAGENLAIDFDDSKSVEDAWMQSPAHHANIVKPEYKKIGIGVASGNYQGRETTFVVELFAASPESASGEGVSVRTASSESSNTRVLGAATAPLPLPVITRIAATPSHLLAYLLVALLTLLLGLFAVALAVHAHLRVRSIEMMGGGAVLVGVVLVALLYVVNDPHVQLPQDSQSASVASAR